MGEREAAIGRRVARARKRRGWGQQQLGKAVDRTPSWVSKIERGDLPLDRNSVIVRLAQALDVEVVELTGQPYRHETAELDSGHAAIPALRLALQHASLPGLGAASGPRSLRSVADLRGVVQQCEDYRQAARFTPVGDLLPGLIEDLLVAAGSYDGDERAEVDALTLRACHIARVTSNLLGHHDLAWTAVQLQLGAAEHAQTPELRAAAEWDLCGVWLHAGALNDARGVATSAIDRLDPLIGAGDGTLLALYGAMHLRAAVAYSRLWSTSDARSHLQAAREVAGKVGLPNVYQTMFGAVNVGIHAVEVELELGHPAEVLTQAHLVDPTKIGSGERQAHYWTVRAAGYAMNRRDDDAVKALAMADRIAPQHVRNRPLAREMVRDLLDRERTRRTQLRSLAAAMHVE
jgi:transcriptional regulator with XRE-family HTH domain